MTKDYQRRNTKRDSYPKTTVSVYESDLKRLWILKRFTGARNLPTLISEILQCPELLSYLIDQHKEEAFGLSKAAEKQLSQNRFLVKVE
jgi:hypothetical protein